MAWQNGLARHWRRGYAVTSAVFAGVFVWLSRTELAGLRHTWDFWLTGTLPPAPVALPNQLHHPVYLATCGLLALWGVVGLMVGRPRGGAVALLFSMLTGGLYWSQDRYGLVSVLGLFIFSLCSAALRPWQEGDAKLGVGRERAGSSDAKESEGQASRRTSG